MRAAAALAVAVGAALSLGSAALADVTVKGDPAAWAEISAAYQKLSALSGYRMKISVDPGGQTMTMEIVQQQRASHTIMQAGSGSMESITVGQETRVRMNMPGAPSGWQCHTAPQMPGARDPSSVQGTVEASRGADTTIEGTPVHTYLYTATFSGESSAAKNILYVGIQTGLPRRTVVTTASGQQTIDYYDYGASITITLPPCG